jgi:hypothetical protein
MEKNNNSNEEVKADLSIFDSIKLSFEGTYGGKIVVIGVLSILYLYYNCYLNHIQFFLSSVAYLLTIFSFLILWRFGCSKNNRICALEVQNQQR